jgi:hypothetical protein
MAEEVYVCEWARRGPADRAVMFLTCPANKHVNAFDCFCALKASVQRSLEHRFDLWIQEVNNRILHHGFNHPYADCHVFKKDQLRLYGFKCHPKHDPRFRVCVLVIASRKKRDETDLRILDRINDLLKATPVREAVDRLFAGEGTKR